MLELLCLVNFHRTDTYTQSKHTPRSNNTISFSSTKATKVRETLAACQPTLPSLLLGRPYIYYQQETSFAVKEVLLSNWPDVIHRPGRAQPMGGGLFWELLYKSRSFTRKLKRHKVLTPTTRRSLSSTSANVLKLYIDALLSTSGFVVVSWIP